MVVSEFQDMGKIIDKNKCGWKIVINERAIKELIENISIEEIKEKKNNVLYCKASFAWHREEEKLLKIYTILIQEPS